MTKARIKGTIRTGKMKGTIEEIVGQESGFLIYNNYCILDNWAQNWALNTAEYSADLRRTVKVENCLTWLIRSGWIEDDTIQYLEYANPVTMEDLMVEGLLYDFGEFKLLAPDGWN